VSRRGANLHENLRDTDQCIATTGPRSKTPGERCRNWRAKGSEYCPFHLYIPQRAARLDQDPIAQLSTIPMDAPAREEERARAIEQAVEREERRAAARDRRAEAKLADSVARSENVLVHPDDMAKVRELEKAYEDALTAPTLRAHIRVVLDQLRRGERLEAPERIPGSTHRGGGPAIHPNGRMADDDQAELHRQEDRPLRRRPRVRWERIPGTVDMKRKVVTFE
jgi:hypothetical protein